MIRAVFFDFYTVWTPDRFSYYLAAAQMVGPEVYKEAYDTVNKYFHGETDINGVADFFRVRLGHPDITAELFKLSQESIAPAIIDLMRNLHAHFLKVGVLGNLGRQEVLLLNNFNEQNQLFEMIASPLSLQTKAPLLSREVFVKALNGIGEPPAQTLLVSGNPLILDFAKSLDINTLQFEGLPKLQTSLDQIATTGSL